MHKILLVAPSLAALLSAQQVVLPEGMYFDHPGLSGLTWRTSAFRFQEVFDSSHFTDQGVVGPISITRMRFRAADGAVTNTSSTYAGVTIQMSSCPLDYASMSTTFASNRGADATTVFTGNVTTLIAPGGSPNGYVIDVTLATPFVYDPTLGSDLCIEVDAPAPVPTTGVPNLATGSVLATHRSQRLSAATQAATTGALSPFANVMLLDFGGRGGYPAWAQAQSADTGAGCYGQARTWYENFPRAAGMDLGNTTLTMTPNALGGYEVQRSGPTAFFPRGLSSLQLTDDSGAARALPAGFGAGLPFPGGVTNTIYICSNGFLWLVPPALEDDDYLPRVGRLVGANARLAPFWLDLLPTPLDNVYFDVDPAGTTVYVTWDAVPCFTTPSARVSMQVALSSNGIVQYRYGSCTGGTGAGIVGWSPGGNAVDPGSLDLSTLTQFSTRLPEIAPLTLHATTPMLGSTVVHTLSNIPPASLLSLRLLGFVPIGPVDLGALGAPGCRQYIGSQTTVTGAMIGAPVATISFAIPPNPQFVGAVLYAQGLSLVPGVNALGVVTSNLDQLLVGNSP